MGFGTILPVHSVPTAVGSGTTFNAFVNPYTDTEKEYSEPAAVGSGTTFNAFVSSSFQYRTTPLIGYVFIDEGLDLGDDMDLTGYFSMEEDQDLDDRLDAYGLVVPDEGQDLGDDLFLDLTQLIDEGQGLTDDTVTYVTMVMDEGIDIGDDLGEERNLIVLEGSGVPLGDDLLLDVTMEMSEGLELGDELAGTMTFTFDEGIDLGDDIYPVGVETLDEGLDLGDDLDMGLTIIMDEGLELGDDTTPYGLVSIDEGTEMEDEGHLIITSHIVHSTRVAVMKLVQDSTPMKVSITPWHPLPVASLNHPDNSFHPQLMVEGITYSDDISQMPVGAYNVKYWDIRAFAGGLCDVFVYSINLNYSGGTFVVETAAPFAAMFDPVTIGGLMGTVTGLYTQSGGGVKRYITSGIFGSRNMNKQLLLVASRDSLGDTVDLLPTIYLDAPTAATWSTVATAAKAIGEAAQIQVAWQAEDQPLLELFGESGLTIIEALQSLASRVNAILCWDGRTGYIVVDPDTGWGGWEGIPDCKLITPGGLRTGKDGDLSRNLVLLPVGVAGSGVIKFDDHPLAAPKPDEVGTIYSTGTVLKPNARVYIDLPGDYKRPALPNGEPAIGSAKLGGKVQIIPNSDKTSNTDPYVVPQATFFITEPDGSTTVKNGPDYRQWYDLNLPIVTDPNTGKDKLVLDSTPFPPNLKNGEYSLNIGYVKDTAGLEENFSQLTKELLDRQRVLQSAENQKTRFIRGGGGSVNVTFYGVIPLGGMRAFVTDGDESLSGLIESVSISNNNMTVGIVDNRKLNLMTARTAIDVSYLTGMKPA